MHHLPMIVMIGGTYVFTWGFPFVTADVGETQVASRLSFRPL